MEWCKNLGGMVAIAAGGFSVASELYLKQSKLGDVH